jgi:hypothetical protein
VEKVELLSCVDVVDEVKVDKSAVKVADRVDATSDCELECCSTADVSLTSLAREVLVVQLELDENSVRVAWTVVIGLVVDTKLLVIDDEVIPSDAGIPAEADQLIEVMTVLASSPAVVERSDVNEPSKRDDESDALV